jgi:hypothetical protein
VLALRRRGVPSARAEMSAVRAATATGKPAIGSLIVARASRQATAVRYTDLWTAERRPPRSLTSKPPRRGAVASWAENRAFLIENQLENVEPRASGSGLASLPASAKRTEHHARHQRTRAPARVSEADVAGRSAC